MLGWRPLPWVILSAAAGLLVALRVSGTSDAGASGRPGTDSPTTQAGEKHYVTPQQLASANAMLDRAAGGLDLPHQDGRPLVVVFLKDGCPCNVEFEPFFQRVEKLYRAEARFVAVLDAGPAAARRYAEQQSVPYPVLPDPERRLIRRLKAENGGYVVLLSPQGAIAGFWPGSSAETMIALGRRISALAGVAERPLDVSDMPGPLTTGCPFDP